MSNNAILESHSVTTEEYVQTKSLDVKIEHDMNLMHTL